jgi:hypothetical protein
MLTGMLNLPRPVQVGLMVAGGGGVAAGVLMLFPKAGLVVLLGLLVVLPLALLAYRAVLRAMRKRKSKPFERELRASGSAVPSSLGADVAGRARLDEIRKKFERGVETFRQHGKDLYGLPWYVFIGEPGSGKTEAVRRCGIGFPPGLHDELQGSGGTYNMDWWFTNHAVILDMAGRLTFGAEESADTREWREFLRLLRKHRPNCPINGLLLAIPVDSLIKDGAEDIERKGGRIARELDVIQRALGVRFPVFAVITKTDVLTGFRPFFRDLRDPDLQGQMVGWTNPAPLDQPFDPAVVGRAVAQVRERLVRRRAGLLQDPVHTEEVSGRRADQVDELFAFPDELERRITGRLQRYLELIFAGGEWSSKPVFLRGIYFTSSMQHGTALDAELAEALAVPVDSLQEQAWTENKAYFLRDVFLSKIFREKGLVTSATNTAALQRSRRRAVVAALGGLAVVVGGLGAWAYHGYQRDVSDVKRSWTYSARMLQTPANASAFRIVVPDPLDQRRYEYNGNAGLGQGRLPLWQILDEARDSAAAAYRSGLAFRVVEWVAGERGLLKEEREDAARAMFEAAVVEPLATVAVERLGRPDLAWDERAVDVLAGLLAARAAADRPAPWPAASAGAPPFDVEALVGFVLDERARGADPEIDTQVRQMQLLCEDVYADSAARPTGLGQAWPPAIFSALDPGLQAAVAAHNHHWLAQRRGSEGTRVGAIRALVQSLKDLDQAERKLLDLAELDPKDLIELHREWTRRQQAFADAASAVGDRMVQEHGGISTVAAAWSAEKGRGEAEEEAAYQRLHLALSGGATGIRDAVCEPEPGDPGPRERLRCALVEGWRSLRSQPDAFDAAELAALDQRMLVFPRADAKPAHRFAFQARAAMYAEAARLLADVGTGDTEPPRLGQTAQRLQQVTSTIDGATESIRRLAAQAGWRKAADPAAPRAEAERGFDQAMRLTTEHIAGRLAAENLRVRIAGQFAGRIAGRRDAAQLQALVAAETQAHPPLQPLPSVPMTALASEGGHPGANQPEAGLGLLRDWVAVDRLVSTPGPWGEELKAEMARTLGPIRGYAAAFQRYWGEEVFERLRPAGPDWTRFKKELLQQFRHQDLTEPVVRLAQSAQEALQALAAFDAAAAERLALDRSGLARRMGQIAASIASESEVKAYDTVLNNWKALPDAALEARRRLEADLGSDFAARYFISAEQGGCVRGFWSFLTNGALDLLAKETKDQVQQAISGMPECKFPLDPPSSAEQMKSEDIERVRRALGDAIVESDREGVLKQLPDEVEQRVGQVLSPLDAATVRWLRQLNAMVTCLPQAGRTFQIEVTLHIPEPPDAPDPAPAYERWKSLTIRQGDQVLGTVSTQRRGAKFNRPIALPGDDLRLEFCTDLDGREPDRGASRDLSYVGPWGALLLLHRTGAVPGKGTGTWRVRLEAPDGSGTTRTAWIELKFDSGSPPPLADWPRKPGR